MDEIRDIQDINEMLEELSFSRYEQSSHLNEVAYRIHTNWSLSSKQKEKLQKRLLSKQLTFEYSMRDTIHDEIEWYNECLTCDLTQEARSAYTDYLKQLEIENIDSEITILSLEESLFDIHKGNS